MSPSGNSIIDKIYAISKLEPLATSKTIIGVWLPIYLSPTLTCTTFLCHTSFVHYVIYKNDQCPLNVDFCFIVSTRITYEINVLFYSKYMVFD